MRALFFQNRGKSCNVGRLNDEAALSILAPCPWILKNFHLKIQPSSNSQGNWNCFFWFCSPLFLRHRPGQLHFTRSGWKIPRRFTLLHPAATTRLRCRKRSIKFRRPPARELFCSHRGNITSVILFISGPASGCLVTVTNVRLLSCPPTRRVLEMRRMRSSWSFSLEGAREIRRLTIVLSLTPTLALFIPRSQILMSRLRKETRARSPCGHTMPSTVSLLTWISVSAQRWPACFLPPT